MAGQQLSQGGLYSLSLNSEGLFSYINSNPPQRYYSTDPFWKGEDHVNFSYGILTNRGMTLVSRTEGLYSLNISFYVPLGILLQFMRFEPDGHLRAYDSDWNEESDLLSEFIGFCDSPMACGNYGICTNDRCSCPPPINGTNYFRQTNIKLPNNGCSLVTLLSCEDSKYHVLSELENITYFPMEKYPPEINPDHRHLNLESCKQACLKDCSCKAAIFNSSNRVGNCYLESHIFSLMSTDARQKTYLKVYIKLRKVTPQQKKHWLEIILGSSFAFVLFLLIGLFVFLFWKKESFGEAEEYYLDHVPGMLTRYSYHDLQAVIEKFSKELGRGGFGTIFEGTLFDGAKVAVKRLDGQSQIK